MPVITAVSGSVALRPTAVKDQSSSGSQPDGRSVLRQKPLPGKRIQDQIAVFVRAFRHKTLSGLEQSCFCDEIWLSQCDRTGCGAEPLAFFCDIKGIRQHMNLPA